MKSFRDWLTNAAYRIHNLLDSSNQSNNIVAPGTQINFDPKLVHRLKQDHVGLLKLYTRIQASLKDREYSKLPFLFNEFKINFNDHALTEYTKLYIFLDRAYRENPDMHAEVMKFKQEMNDIGRAVRAFCNSWMEAEISRQNALQLEIELGDIGNVLSHRIVVEEERLYNLYDNAVVELARKNRRSLQN